MMAMSDTMSKSSPDIQILTGDVQTEVSKHQGAIRQRHAGRGIIQSVHVLPCKSQDNLVKGVADDVRFRSLSSARMPKNTFQTTPIVISLNITTSRTFPILLVHDDEESEFDNVPG